MIVKFGGIDGIRDEGMLQSAVSLPLQKFDSNDLYPSVVEKIIRLSFDLVMNHPFFDGNKRIAAKVLDVGLRVNGILLKATNKDMIDEFFGLASGSIIYQEYLIWVQYIHDINSAYKS